jgi:Fe-S-cluster-containing dehydrogenase component
MSTQIRMVIDLSLCVGCGTCGIACKAGNNTAKGTSIQSYRFGDVISTTTGAFPSAVLTAIPTMCNHCVNPNCVKACPVAASSDARCVGGKRKAMYKLTADHGGLVLHDAARCIGCGKCQRLCPYSRTTLKKVAPYTSAGRYSVISKNQVAQSPVQTKWTAVLRGTLSTLPTINNVSATDKKQVDKCKFCVHRLFAVDPLIPYCVQACSSHARKIVFSDGDIGGAGVITSFKDDAGNVYSGNSNKTMTAATFSAASAKVLRHYAPTAKTDNLFDTEAAYDDMSTTEVDGLLTDPIVTGNGQPKVYYINSYSKR